MRCIDFDPSRKISTHAVTRLLERGRRPSRAVHALNTYVRGRLSSIDLPCRFGLVAMQTHQHSCKREAGNEHVKAGVIRRRETRRIVPRGILPRQPSNQVTIAHQDQEVEHNAAAAKASTRGAAPAVVTVSFQRGGGPIATVLYSVRL